MKPAPSALVVFRSRLKTALGVILLSLVASAFAEDAIMLHYNERPPYLHSNADGSASGLTATPAGKAFTKAGIPFIWKLTPANRQLLVVQNGEGKDCAVGWFKNAEREKLAKYTKAIYQDQPTVAIAHSSVAVKEGGRFEDAIADKNLRLLVKKNYSYGPFIDAIIARGKPTVSATIVESIPMVQIIMAARADLMLAAEEEAAHLIKESGGDAASVKVIRFSDMPPGEKRYILCSKAVGDDVIDKLNAAISFK
jgi:polar amino acid transport system substrate-binding protein